MRWFKIAYLLLGLALLAAVLWQIEMRTVLDMAVRVGLLGMAVVLLVYLAAFVIDSLTWQMAIQSAPLNLRWLYRAWKVRMVGEVFNNVIPAGGFGGEPVKAVLLKKYYGIGYREGTASLILGKTVNMVSLILFLAGGFVLVLGAPALPVAYKTVAGAGLAALCLGVVLFFLIQRFRVASLAGTWLGGRRLGRRIAEVLHLVRDMDERLVRFYTAHRARFVAAVLLALVNWLLGVVEIYAIMIFLGHPVTLADAWIVEALVQLVRAGAFVIPAGIGAQEGVFMLVFTAMTGSPDLGVAAALVRRCREVIWLLWGALLGSLFSLAPEHAGAGTK
ncbi:MAG: flippase-like domain-containing protein [Hyphomicrobiales bacterium]|nr:flippase-like domain-containing protein [Hyphomicrobiales bacterium]